MSWLLPKPPLNPDERILWRSPAAMSIRTAVGGTLYVTRDRVLFVPNRLNNRRNRPTHEWPLGDLQSVAARDRDFTPYTGGTHKRLGLTFGDGTTVLFVVKRLDEALGALQGVVASHS